MKVCLSEQQFFHSSSISKARVDQEATSSRPCRTLLLTWPC